MFFVLLLPDPLIHPQGGLTPSLGFSSWLVMVLVVPVWDGFPHGGAAVVPDSRYGMGHGTPRDSWFSFLVVRSGWMGFRAAEQGGCSGFPALGGSERTFGCICRSGGAVEGDWGMLTCPSPMLRCGWLRGGCLWDLEVF